MEIENYTCFPQAQKGALCNELVMQQHLECGVTASPGPPTEAHGSHKRGRVTMENNHRCPPSGPFPLYDF